MLLYCEWVKCKLAALSASLAASFGLVTALNLESMFSLLCIRSAALCVAV